MIMSKTLPPLAAIRVFEAAARHQNFTRAAAELGMTQAAVSYQIKILEDRVGAPLFLRRGRGVSLSDIGERLLPAATEAFDLLSDAFESVKFQSVQSLSISCNNTFANSVLAPRMGLFQIENPSLAVRVRAEDGVADFSLQKVDVAIRAGLGTWPDVEVHKLLDANFSPMLSPELADSIGGVKTPKDLLKLPVVEPSDPWWRAWFAAAGLPNVKLNGPPNLKFGSQVLEAKAAMAGQGVGILTPAFYQNDLAAKRLIQPFDLVCSEGRRAYWLVYPKSRRNAPQIKIFREWLLGIMHTSYPQSP